MAQGKKYTIDFSNFSPSDLGTLARALDNYYITAEKRIKKAKPPWRTSERAMYLGSITILKDAVLDEIKKREINQS